MARGRIGFPQGKRLLFLSQKPYIPVGSLRSAMLFPGNNEADDETLDKLLGECGLPKLVGQLNRDENWQLFLSGDEQQRLAIARCLLNEPGFIFLDESTSALDEDSERDLYLLLSRRLPDVAIVSIGHRSSLDALHDERVELVVPAPPEPANAASRAAAD